MINSPFFLMINKKTTADRSEIYPIFRQNRIPSNKSQEIKLLRRWKLHDIETLEWQIYWFIAVVTTLTGLKVWTQPRSGGNPWKRPMANSMLISQRKVDLYLARSLALSLTKSTSNLRQWNYSSRSNKFYLGPWMISFFVCQHHHWYFESNNCHNFCTQKLFNSYSTHYWCNTLKL